ncbi:MAG: N-acetylglutaminylglutamine synthetase [Rhodospirillales bacterium]|nr:MAG: N-acetylglutaminylglutamine synthetase [Rhodospirillales bacterium]
MNRPSDRDSPPEDYTRMASLKHWGEPPKSAAAAMMARNVVVDCGWGRLLFGQTFADPKQLAEELKAEAEGCRDVAMYVRDPHVVLSFAPQTLFLDPSHTFRLDLTAPPVASVDLAGIVVRMATAADQRSVHRIYRARQMVPPVRGFCGRVAELDAVDVLVAVDSEDGEVTGVVMGLDHVAAFKDPDNGSSLWSLAVDPQSRKPGVGEALVLSLADHFRKRGRAFMDLSVMHDNEQAIALYRKLGFQQVPVYCLKKKNPINEKLFVGPALDASLNIYARIIIDEARRRGIDVDIEDAEAGLFTLTLGGRAIACRESLSELTTAVAMSRCDDKALTLRLLARAELRVPDQIPADDPDEMQAFLARHGRVVVKPARGEQGRGVFVDLRTDAEVEAAVKEARAVCEQVIVEEFCTGADLRIIVIDSAVVAAAVRRPARIKGDGRHTVAELIEKQSRRRAAATGGESQIPTDAETERCIRDAGFAMDSVLPDGQALAVRKTANLHTGGTIHDVTPRLHPALAEAAVKGARVLNIPVVGFDFLVADVGGPDYVIIEANERPGLANHEPQPTAERFVDLLFPNTRAPAESIDTSTHA